MNAAFLVCAHGLAVNCTSAANRCVTACLEQRARTLIEAGVDYVFLKI
jgi:hypothetical protein